MAALEKLLASERFASPVDSEVGKRLAHVRSVCLKRVEPAQRIVRERILVLNVVRAAAVEWLVAHPRAQPGLHKITGRLQLALHDSSGTPSIGDEASA